MVIAGASGVFEKLEICRNPQPESPCFAVPGILLALDPACHRNIKTRDREVLHVRTRRYFSGQRTIEPVNRTKVQIAPETFEVDYSNAIGIEIRVVGDAKYQGQPVRVSGVRIYGAGIKQLWDAVTSAENFPHWFAAPTGE